MRQYLSDAKFPCTKSELVSFARDHKAPAEVIRSLEGMQDKRYESLTDVTREISLF